MRLRGDDYVWKEKRTQLKRKWITPHFCNLGHGIVRCNAHCSVYSVTEQTKDMIVRSGSTRKWSPVHYSSVLWMDVDSMLGGQEVTARLDELGVKYTRFFSGKKGFHFAIPRKAEPDEHLCYLDRDLVYELFRDLKYFDDIDMSIYQPLRVIRSVGCQHEKSGKYKVIDREVVQGKVLSVIGRTVSELDKHLAAYPIDMPDTPFEKLRVAIITSTIHNTKYHTMWALAKDLFKAGANQAAVLSIVGLLNQDFDNPKETSEVERAVNDAYRAIFK